MPQHITKGYAALLAEAEAVVETLDAASAVALADDPGVTLVDLRDPRELEREGRIPGAFHCPRGMLEFWIDPASPYHKPQFAEDRRFVFLCAGGWRSALAAKAAQDMGLAPVAHVAGGFKAWREAGGSSEPGRASGSTPAASAPAAEVAALTEAGANPAATSERPSDSEPS